MKQQRNSTSRRFSGFLETGTSFTGDLRFEGTVRIDGEVDGSVSTPDVLVVGPSAIIRATIQAGAVQVHGHIVGDVSCTRRLELCAGGRIEGSIETPHLVIEDGATFDGGSRMTGVCTSDEPSGDGESITTPETEPEADPTPVPDTPPAERPAGEAQPQLTRWKSLRRQLESAATRAFSTAASESE